MALLVNEKTRLAVCAVILLTATSAYPSPKRNRTAVTTLPSSQRPNNTSNATDVDNNDFVFPTSDPVLIFENKIKQILTASGRHDAKTLSETRFNNSAFIAENENLLISAMNNINNQLLPHKYQGIHNRTTGQAIISDET